MHIHSERLLDALLSQRTTKWHAFFQPEDVIHNKALCPRQLGQEASPAAAHFPLHQIQSDILKLHRFMPGNTGFRWSRPFPDTRHNGSVEHLFRGALCSKR